MTEDEKYMGLCIELASRALGKTAPNPLVGAVVVHKGNIIGQGYHEEFGKAHAEVNAIASVENKSLLEQSTLYVNLEPCAHHGKTPPCADLIVANKIPKVVIGSSDPFPEVSGKGIEILRSAGIEVVLGILESECIDLNKRFYTFYTRNRPYIILKWAQSNDGFIAPIDQKPGEQLKITNSNTNILVHQWRSQEQGILVGKGTILADDPQLNVRLIEGRSPLPFLFAKKEDIPRQSNILSRNPVFVNSIEELEKYCFDHKIQSVLVEGGLRVLNHFIDHHYWDEARIITNKKMNISNGLSAPKINLPVYKKWSIEDDEINIILNSNRK